MCILRVYNVMVLRTCIQQEFVKYHNQTGLSTLAIFVVAAAVIVVLGGCFADINEMCSVAIGLDVYTVVKIYVSFKKLRTESLVHRTSRRN